MKTKCLAVGIILLFLGTSIIPTIGQTTEKQSVSRGTWLYVGGSGPGNYSKIQDAINDSFDGDTVFVFDDSSPYNESINISDKQITLLGENRNTTVILRHIFCLNSESITLAGFTIIDDVIFEHVQNLTFIDNNLNGLTNMLEHCNSIVISSNFFNSSDPWDGGMLYVTSCSNLNITRNIFSGNSVYGVRGCCISGKDCLISENRFVNLSNALIATGTRVTIMRNSFIDNNVCVIINPSLFTKVVENNFINTSKYQAVCLIGFGNVWDRNYWGHPRLLPQPIYAYSGYILAMIINYLLDMGGFNISWSCYYIPIVYKYDWHPAQEPYDIPEMN